MKSELSDDLRQVRDVLSTDRQTDLWAVARALFPIIPYELSLRADATRK